MWWRGFRREPAGRDFGALGLGPVFRVQGFRVEAFGVWSSESLWRFGEDFGAPGGDAGDGSCARGLSLLNLTVRGFSV